MYTAGGALAVAVDDATELIEDGGDWMDDMFADGALAELMLPLDCANVPTMRQMAATTVDTAT